MPIVEGSAAAATPQNGSIAGVQLTFVAADATNGHKFANTGRTRVLVKNASGGVRTVTFQRERNLETDISDADRTGSVADGQEKLFGPFPTDLYSKPPGDANAGSMFIGFDSATGVTFAVIEG